MKSVKANKGITLIALVITIIILLILAGISIATLTGENGILNKVSKAKEEHLVEQYKEEINLIIIDEIAERKTENKEELMIVSLDTKIREKEWVNEIYKCNSSGEEQPTFEVSTHLLVESKEHYEFLIEVNEAKQTAKIVSFQKGTGEKYTITYHPNGGEGQEETIEVRQGFSVTLKECDYTREQYKFVGWCENQNGEGERYLGNASYKPEGHVTLYAIWELNVATITFNSNDGTSNTKQVTVTKGKETKLSVNSFTRERYTFLEWNTKADGTGEQYEEEAMINVEADITLYAIWKTNVNTEGKWDGEVNSPKLAGEMITVYWKQDGSEVTGEVGENWYHYKAGNNSTDTRASHWANAKTADGSYWVWIPRYEYKILSGEGTSTAGKIEVKFIPTSKTTADAGYKIHPAFRNGTSNDFKNGEWDKELDGIWVAKYEASHSDASISAEGSSSTMKIVPGVQSWRNITIGDCYTKAYNYDRAKKSHMMKNSEWGAVAYLTHSQYGRNGNEIDINNSSTFITGNGGGSPTASSASGVTNAYNTETGAKASTTGNIYGIYDLSGGAWERTAGYITNGNSYLSKGSSFVAKTTADGKGYQTLSTKYATVYPYNTSSDSYTNNYTSYKNVGYGYGNAIIETSTSGSGTTSWFSDYSYFPSESNPFFCCGGSHSNGANAGAFYFGGNNGTAHTNSSFRPVLAF